MKAVVLAGGFATRLRPLSCTRPKILFPVLNKPLLQWTFERLVKSSVRDVVLAVFHQTEVYIKQHRVPRCGLHVTYSHDPLKRPLGTAGSIKKAERLIGRDSPFLALNGDIFDDVDYVKLLNLHRKKRGVATITLREVRDPSRYGVAKLNEDGRITSFIEKPPKGTALSSLINAGAYALSPEIFDYIPEGREVSIEREVFPKLAERGLLYGYVYKGLWTDIGKPQDYLDLNEVILRRNEAQEKFRVGVGVEINRPVYLGKGVSAGKRSTIGPNVVLGPKVTLGNDVRVQNSVVMSASTISDSVVIDGAIIGEGAYIGRKVRVPRGCIIGDHARIRDNIFLAEKTWICPANEVSENVLMPASK